MLYEYEVFIAGAAPREAAGGGMNFLIPMIAILVLFFWLTHRSQKKKDQEREEMLDSIKAGDDIITIGGIYGRVTKVTEDGFEVRINTEKDVKIKVTRGSVRKMLKQEREGEKSE